VTVAIAERPFYGGPFTSHGPGEAGGDAGVARSAPDASRSDEGTSAAARAFKRVDGGSPLARGAQHSARGLHRRVVEPCERLLCDLVRQGLSREALPAAAALILLLEADAVEREAEAA
jgi:hypothetical protein